jgi:hypothetical protein
MNNPFENIIFDSNKSGTTTLNDLTIEDLNEFIKKVRELPRFEGTDEFYNYIKKVENYLNNINNGIKQIDYFDFNNEKYSKKLRISVLFIYGLWKEISKGYRT